MEKLTQICLFHCSISNDYCIRTYFHADLQVFGSVSVRVYLCISVLNAVLSYCRPTYYVIRTTHYHVNLLTQKFMQAKLAGETSCGYPSI